MPRKPMFIMAGGTGGHVYPALAVADYLRECGVQLYWLGTRHGLEARVLPQSGYPLLTISVAGLRRKGVLRWLSSPILILVAVVQALVLMFRHRPSIVLGMGGFVSGPGGVAAWLLRIPLLIHEQNAIAGLTNRLLAPFARVIMQGFPGAFAGRHGVQTTGNPVRADIARLPPPEQRLAGRKGQPLRLLILGGSQGARVLNECVPAAARILRNELHLEIWHQTGPRHLEETRKIYGDARVSGGEIKVEPYIDDMAAAYAWADVVLCRAGALTIAELSVVGVAAILVPYPFAVDDHQTANARHLSKSGCAVLLPEAELDPEGLAALLRRTFSDRDRLLQIAGGCRQHGRPEAARLVGEICLGAARA
ncbi:MAG: undecaprenyldiphospho-muramoylpentapeptide beta-N-acetylglucosaminyltransferase [Longimicrobiales bacterium]